MKNQLNKDIRELISNYPEYTAMNNAILKYVYSNISNPSETLEKDIHQQTLNILAAADDKQYETIEDIRTADPETVIDEKYIQLTDHIELLLNKIENPDNKDAYAEDDEIVDLSGVKTFDHYTPKVIEYANTKPYVYNETLLNEVKTSIDNDIQLAKDNEAIIFVSPDEIYEVTEKINDATDNNEKKQLQQQLKELKSKQSEAVKKNKQYVHEAYTRIQDKLYFIKPDPSSNLKFLVYETADINYFTEYNKSIRSTKILKNQYKGFDVEFKKEYSFNKFFKYLDYYEETERTSYNILFKDGYVFNFNDLTISSYIDEIPSVKSDLQSADLTVRQKRILDKYFYKMYPKEDTFKQFLLYILCNFNKYHIKQSNFINIDESGVGKTARISAMLELGFNCNADSNVLKKSELYNVANYNMLIVNEADKTRIDGSVLSDFADSTPKDYTVKGGDTMRVNAEDRPLLTITGENLPLLEKLNTGTERRFLLIPKVSKSYNFLVRDIRKIENGTIEDNAENRKKYDYDEYKEFYRILYNNHMEVIQYYLMKIKEYNIVAEAEAIAKTMKVTIEDITKLLTTTEDIFNKFFIAEPTAKDDIIVGSPVILIGKDQSLNNLLNLINRDHIKTDKFNSIAAAKKSLNQWLKETNEVKNIKDYGRKSITIATRKYEEAFYIHQLTQYAVKIIDEHNKNAKPDEKIHYLKLEKTDET